MEIIFKNSDRSTDISISDESVMTDKEIMIETHYDGQEAWHTFESHKEFKKFIKVCQKMNKRLKKATK